MTAETQEIAGDIRKVLAAHGGLAGDVSALGDSDDLFRAGMTSHANVTVMLALESLFAIEFPEDMLRRSTFESVAAIRSAICEILGEGPSG